ncbi:nucleotidyltransferase domain-containing protein [Vulcanisaeta souniana]|uniref:type VII toxin-antitoxin system MntA family adenylyltransferase antitoxin n=1 Tax=Vulcanisaeta souniana TaxID=164452 RepID=UPI0006D1D1A3|nr:HepT-like ribonuclease domain-containing protein [Vulcanisaeta souniana]
MEINDVFREYALRWLLYAVHQDLLDALAMVVAELGLRKPPSYAGLADVLHERRLISDDVKELIRQVVINRSMLAHAYRSFSRSELLELRSWVLKNVPSLANQLLRLMEENNVDPEMPGESLVRVFTKYGVLLAFLFGSRARGGDVREDSDYDVAVLMRDQSNYEKMVSLIRDLAQVLGAPADKVDLVDLSKAPNELVYVVLRDGVLIYSADPVLARRLIAHMYVRVLGESDLDHVYYSMFRDRISKKHY